MAQPHHSMQGVINASRSESCVRQHETLHAVDMQGKVRDTYGVADSDKLVIVTTDRQSAFDRLLASIPFKVLHLINPLLCTTCLHAHMHACIIT